MGMTDAVARRRPLWNEATSRAASSRRVVESASFVSFRLRCKPATLRGEGNGGQEAGRRRIL